jgi:membrane associated rhomboid family serine protease
VWLATVVLRRYDIYLERWLALFFWQDSYFNVAQPFTYMFMHDAHSFVHIFFNMFSLWMFGGLLERVMGSKRYLIYYIVCGLGAALVQELMWQFSLQEIVPTVGASGAVFGILLAFGMIFPNMPMYIFFIPVPIKAKWVVIGYGLLELYFGISGNQPGVAHFAHLGGMLAGIIMMMYWRHNGTLKRGNGYY